LSPGHRKFVDGLLMGLSQTEAACQAGYARGDATTDPYGKGHGAGTRAYAHHLAHRRDVQEAILEASRGEVSGELPQAVRKIVELASGLIRYPDPNNPDVVTLERVPAGTQLKAATWVAAQAGMRDVIEHKVEVTLTDAEKLKELHDRAVRLGLDPTELLGDVTDAEFEVIADHPAPQGMAQEEIDEWLANIL
jgi:hypothetical protein